MTGNSYFNVSKSFSITTHKPPCNFSVPILYKRNFCHISIGRGKAADRDAAKVSVEDDRWPRF